MKEYDIKYDSEILIPIDDTLVNDVYEAAMDLVLDVGVLCTSTERLIKFEDWEVKEALRTAPSEFIIGEGHDAVTMKHRDPQGQDTPVIWGGVWGVPLSEDMAPKIYQSHAQEPIVNVMAALGSVETVEGMIVKAGSPLEMQSELKNICWARMAIRNVGRPGMPLVGTAAVTPFADIGMSSPEFGWRKCDVRILWLLPELKTDYEQLCKAAHYMAYGCPTRGGGTPCIGGFSGGPEGTTIAQVAEAIIAVTLYQSECVLVNAIDAFYPSGHTARRSMWSINLAHTAINKNTHIVTIAGPYATYAGQCTDMSLFEIAASTIGVVKAGSHPEGVGGLSANKTDYTTGMEARFMGEAAHAVSGINREDANEMVKTLLPKYEDRIKARNPPIGKKFQECYDVKKITPSKEYLELYRKVKNELEDIGLKFNC